MQKIHQAVILKNQALSSQLYEMVLQVPELALKAKPGQFVMVLPSLNNDSHDPLLRRPFGLSGIYPLNGQVRLTYQILGKGTLGMSRWQPGDKVDIIGPLGQGFTWSQDIKQVFLVGGGMGIAPLLPLAQALVNQQKKVTAYLGARSKQQLIGYQEIKDLGCEIYTATENGSHGYEGFITQPLAQGLKKLPCDMLFACGPTPFLKAVACLSNEYSIPAQLSLEERMACGVGACMGCAVQLQLADGEVKYGRVCADGPVFRAEEVVL